MHCRPRRREIPCTATLAQRCTVQGQSPVHGSTDAVPVAHCGRQARTRPMITLNPDSPTPLVSQIVDGFRRLIGDQTLKPGAKLPSIRGFAASHHVSVFTVVEAYDRLVAQGWLVSRANAGFFVKRRPGDAAAANEPPRPDLRF